jgi:hypothetical protein
MKPICALCGQTVDNERDAYRQVVGWERPGKGMNNQSGSSIVLRSHTLAVAHPDCIVKLQHGTAPTQEVLL